MVLSNKFCQDVSFLGSRFSIFVNIICYRTSVLVLECLVYIVESFSGDKEFFSRYHSHKRMLQLKDKPKQLNALKSGLESGLTERESITLTSDADMVYSIMILLSFLCQIDKKGKLKSNLHLLMWAYHWLLGGNIESLPSTRSRKYLLKKQPQVILALH